MKINKKFGKFWKPSGASPQTPPGALPRDPGRGLQASLQPPAGAPSEPLPIDSPHPNQNPEAASVTQYVVGSSLKIDTLILLN